jgi:hypothetical protein
MIAEDVVWQQVVDHKLLRIAHNAAYFCLVAPRPLQLLLSRKPSIISSKNLSSPTPSQQHKSTIFNSIIDKLPL